MNRAAEAYTQAIDNFSKATGFGNVARRLREAQRRPQRRAGANRDAVVTHRREILHDREHRHERHLHDGARNATRIEQQRAVGYALPEPLLLATSMRRRDSPSRWRPSAVFEPSTRRSSRPAGRQSQCRARSGCARARTGDRLRQRSRPPLRGGRVVPVPDVDRGDRRVLPNVGAISHATVSTKAIRTEESAALAERLSAVRAVALRRMNRSRCSRRRRSRR